MSGKVRADCEQSYYPSKSQSSMAAKPDSGASGPTGGDTGGWIGIVAGVKAGEKVVSKPTAEIHDGSRVQ